MSEFRVYAPLSRFLWRGSTFSVAPGVEIIRRPQPYPLRGLDEDLTRFDRDQLFFADHWLTVDWSKGGEPRHSEIVNLFHCCPRTPGSLREEGLTGVFGLAEE